MMRLHKSSTGRHFTDAARLAAKEAKRRKREEALPLDEPEIFIVRSSLEPSRFDWEIRLFGGVVLSRSPITYLTPAAARSAGISVLAGSMNRRSDAKGW